jgi:hypothetical protein
MRGREKGPVTPVRSISVVLEMYRRERFDVGTSHCARLRCVSVWSVLLKTTKELHGRTGLTANGHDSVHHTEREV